MAEILGPTFGNSQNGIRTVTGNEIINSVYSPITGSSGGTTLTTTNQNGTAKSVPSGFQAGQFIVISQVCFPTGGISPGSFEFNTIDSVSASTMTVRRPLSYSYVTNESADKIAVVWVMPEYGSFTINSGASAIAEQFGNDQGRGIVALKSAGDIIVTGSINVTGKGFGGGGTSSDIGYNGMSPYVATSKIYTSTYYSGGQGGSSGNNGGGGGGHSVAGTGASPGGNGGSIIGQNNQLGQMLMGAGGGGSANNTYSSGGEKGGGMVILIGKNITVTGSIVSNGNSTSAAGPGGSTVTVGGAGAGGSILLIGQTLAIGTNLITAIGGTGATASNGNRGGNGGSGRIHLIACSLTGTTNPTAYQVVGGQNFCGALAEII